MLYEAEKQVAIASAIAAASLCEQVRSEKDSYTIEKPDSSPVTLADFGSQAVICHTLAQAFANDQIIAEEDGEMLQQPAFAECLSGVTRYVHSLLPDASSSSIISWINRGKGKVAPRYWTLDPIDGTKGFIRGDQYAIAIALIEQGIVKVGVLACPALPIKPTGAKGVLFVAVKDQGTTMMSLDGADSLLLRVNQSDDLNDLQVIESVEAAHSDRLEQEAIANALGLTQPAKQMDSQAKYGIVARGEADLYLRIPQPDALLHKENIWDHAAGSLVVCEAGGRVTDLEGKLLDFSVGSKLSNNHGIVASNGTIHEKVLTTIQRKN